MTPGNSNASLSIDDTMTPAPVARRTGVTVLAITVGLLALAACKPAATVQNNSTAPLIVDGNYDDANFVVPGDEGSGDENGAMPIDSTGGAGTTTNTAVNSAHPHGGGARH